MLMIQMTGLSGAGKSSIAGITEANLTSLGYKVQVLDGDECRRTLCTDLGYSKSDRIENIYRLGYVGLMLAGHGVISLLAVINPYEQARRRLKEQSTLTRTVFIDCPLETLVQRDTKGLYRKALLPETHPDHLCHLTGINDPYEVPLQPDLTIETHTGSLQESAQKLTDFILQNIPARGSVHQMSPLFHSKLPYE
jgi:adenylylsulfate kinase